MGNCTVVCPVQFIRIVLQSSLSRNPRDQHGAATPEQGKIIMTRIDTTPSGRAAWIARRFADVLVLAAGIALALPLIVPFS
jgi:hypothetical protein